MRGRRPPVPIVCVSRDVSWRYICVTVPTGQSPSMSGPAPSNRPVGPMARRAELLEFAVLGLLHESPMHGYELRKRLNTALGAFRALSYGSSTPALRELLTREWIAEVPQATRRLRSRRARIVYELTHTGKERFQELVDGPSRVPGRTTSSPSTWPSSPARPTRCGCASSRAGAPGSRSGSPRSGRPRSATRADGRLHRGPAAARRGAGRARGPLAGRTDHHRTQHPRIPKEHLHGIHPRRHRRRRQLRQLAGAGRRVLQGRLARGQSCPGSCTSSSGRTTCATSSSWRRSTSTTRRSARTSPRRSTRPRTTPSGSPRCRRPASPCSAATPSTGSASTTG